MKSLTTLLFVAQVAFILSLQFFGKQFAQSWTAARPNAPLGRMAMAIFGGNVIYVSVSLVLLGAFIAHLRYERLSKYPFFAYVSCSTVLALCAGFVVALGLQLFSGESIWRAHELPQ
jgi:hypothetical protein